MRTIDEAREVLREGQAMLEQNAIATQGEYHDAIDALRVAFAVIDEHDAAGHAWAAEQLEQANAPWCRMCGERGHHECGAVE